VTPVLIDSLRNRSSCLARHLEKEFWWFSHKSASSQSIKTFNLRPRPRICNALRQLPRSRCNEVRCHCNNHPRHRRFHQDTTYWNQTFFLTETARASM